MKAFQQLTGALMLCLFVVACAPSDKPTHWFKGNLHAHSYWSDGNEFPEVIMEWYKTNGYDFTVLSDHNTLAEGDKWITLSKQTYLQEGFENYVKAYGEDWVEQRMDTAGNIQVKLKTYDEYKGLFNAPGEFLIVPSEEITTGFEGKPVHINATNIQERIAPVSGQSIIDVIQQNLNQIHQQREALNRPIMAHLNHPNFYYSNGISDIIELNGLTFFEVYNGHPMVNNAGDSAHASTEQIWDQVNIAYSAVGKRLLYGLATDDSHQYHRSGKQYANAGRGWVMVAADSLAAGSLIKAMEEGDFYASTGVNLSRLSFRDNRLKVQVDSVAGTAYTINFIGHKKGEQSSATLASVQGVEATFEVTEDYSFVRAVVTSNKTNPNFFDELEFEKAWIQPVVYQK